MHDTTNAPPDQITTLDVSRILGRSVERVRQLCREGRLRPIRTPTGIRIFSRKEVLKLRAALPKRPQARRIDDTIETMESTSR